MANAPTVEVNPSILTWAREESGYAVERVAKRLHVKEERVAAWEKGERQPHTAPTGAVSAVSPSAIQRFLFAASATTPATGG